MKKLLLSLALLTLVLANAKAECTLVAKVKKANAASALIGDVSFTKKQLEALSSQCKITRSNMSVDDLIKLEETAYQKRISKLKTAKN